MSGSRTRIADAARRPPARAQLPLLDRLIDEAPDQTRDAPLSAAEAMDALRRSVQRDMEALLNARRPWRTAPARFAELPVSPLGFGIPDCTAGAFDDPRRREAMRADIEAAIRRFEPRFASVRVSLTEGKGPLEPLLRLRIDAMLRADPAPEPVAFDSVVDPATSVVAVRARDDI